MSEQSNKPPRKAAAPKNRAPRATAAKSATPKTRERSSTRKPARTVRLTPEQVRDRAYFLYLERGRTNGDDQADWYRAEQELLESATA
jgi:hypothetical protein